MKKLKLFSLLMLLFVGVTSMWADHVTSVANIVSGQKYYIGSTKSNSTDYYLQVTGRGATTGKVKGTAVTSKDDADLFTFTQVTGGWTIQFENGKYLVLPNAKDNGKVYVQADAGSWTLADASSLISFKYGDFYLKNNQATNTTNFGMYASGQLDLWLEPAATASTPKVSYEAAPTGGTLLLKHGETNLASGDEVEADEEVTVIATPGEGYKLPATISFKDGENQDVDPDDLTFIENVDKNGGAFLMPNYDLTVAASFTAKTVSAVTVNNPEHGEITVTGAENLAAVMEGTELTVNIAGSGYTFSLKYKEGEGEWKALENGGVITMPAQALTISADEAEITSPYITPSVAKVDFGAVVKDASVDAVEFNIEGNYLTEGNLSVSLLDGTAFEVAPAYVPVNGALSATKITVTAKSTATAGTFEDILVISGGGLANDVELDVVLTVQELHTATWFVNGEELKSQNAVAGTALDIPAKPTTLAEDCADLKFRGWAAAPIDGKLDDAPEFVTTEGLKMGDADANYYAVFATEKKEEIDGDIEWVATAFADLATDDVVVYASESYAMSNNNGSSNAPSAVAITAAAGKLTAEPATTIQWTIEKDGTSIQFKNSTNYLYCIGQNNGIRVGSGEAKVFSIKDAYLYNDGQERYCGVYNNADWRSYTTINSNITGQTFTFYKKTVSKQEVTSYIDFRTTCPTCTTVALTKGATSNGSFQFQVGGAEVSSVKTCEAANVDVVFSPAEGYELSAFTITGVDGASYNEGVISIPQDATGTLIATAEFGLENHNVTMAQTGGASASISADQNNKHAGDEITVTANDVDGYYFIGWAASPGVSFANAKALSTTFTMPSSDVTVTAKYTKILTVAEAIEKYDKSGNTSDVVVEAYVSSFYSSSVSSGQISYFIQDKDENGFLTGTEFEAYKGKGFNGADFAALNDIAIGDKVRIFGNLRKYNSTYELDENNYLLAQTVKGEVTSVEVYGTASKTEYFNNDDFEFTGLKAKQVFENGYAEEIASPAWAASPAKVTVSGNVAVTATYNEKTSAPYNVAVIKVLREPTLSWSEETPVYLVGQENTFPTVNNPKSLPLTYESSTPAVADIDANGEVTLHTAGATTLKFSFAGDDEYAAKQNVEYNLVVYDLESVSVNGTANVTAYEAGSEFDRTGLTAQANYKSGELTTNFNITEDATVVWSCDPATVDAGTSKVTVSATWNGKTGTMDVSVAILTHTVKFADPEHGSLVVKNAGTQIASGDEFANGTVLTVEANPDPEEDYYLAALTVNETDIKAEKEFTVGLLTDYTVVATFAERTVAPISWGEASESIALNGDVATLQALTNDEDLTVVYSSDNTDAAMVDPATGAITLKGVGSAEISAKYTATTEGQYKTTTVTYTLNVTAATYAVTFDAPTNGTLVILNGSESITSGDEFVEGTKLDVVATPASNYILATLTANGEDIKSSAQVIIGTADVVVVATFEKDATALDNTEASEKVVKTMENGVLIIRRGDKTYNGQGQLIK